MHGFLILCDFAEAINGKLYVQGGGWSRIGVPPGAPVSIHVAGQILVPWDDANRRRRLLVELFNEDGQNVRLGESSDPVEMRGDFEVGRPPGLAPGTELDFTFAVRFEGMPLPSGRYKFVLTAGATQIDEVKFEVLEAQIPGPN
ncbi:DUF6941 family protein [Microbacterium sp. CJ77]|uniref:DUF6941 family protein n=1 Tax=Microbacterium sp. CJ77 TaxID=2079201 RepID=UPI000C2C8139|nr:hypothetical protein [Microbacterium sp. CJ77]